MMTFILTVALVFIIAIAEQVLSALGARWYFKLGIPIFRKTVRLGGEISVPMATSFLEGIIPSSSYARLLVRQVDANEFAVREKVFDFSRGGYTPVMRCLVTLDPIKREATTLGLLNAYPVVFSVMVLTLILDVMLAGEGLLRFLPFLFIPFMSMLFYWIYSIQAKRFTGLCNALGGIQQGGT